MALILHQRQGPDPKKVGRAFVERDDGDLALATIPGFFGVGGGPSRAADPTASTSPRSHPGELTVPQEVVMSWAARLAQI